MHKAMRVVDRIEENQKTITVVMDQSLEATPGQFCMLWLPGVDESHSASPAADPLMFTVSRVGPFSDAVHSLSKGDTLWVRGPFGTGWSVGSGRTLLVGGGYGAAPLYFLARMLQEGRGPRGSSPRGKDLRRPPVPDAGSAAFASRFTLQRRTVTSRGPRAGHGNRHPSSSARARIPAVRVRAGRDARGARSTVPGRPTWTASFSTRHTCAAGWGSADPASTMRAWCAWTAPCSPCATRGSSAGMAIGPYYDMRVDLMGKICER